MKLRETTPAILSVAVAVVLACRPQAERFGPSTQRDRELPSYDVSLEAPSPDADQPARYPGLRNMVAYGAGLLSGSAPIGDEGFDSLRAIGVRTVVSVDGAAPDLPRAIARGMRYVHLPIGYGGIARERTLELAKAVQMAREEAPSAPVYIHCHHGKHRSACASAVVAVTLGCLTPGQALSRMNVSGAASNYAGLYRCVAEARLADPEELAAVRCDFPAAWKTTGLVKSMVAIGEHFEHLEAIERAGWSTPVEHRDLVPAAEAGILADLLRGLLDDRRVKAKPANFRERLTQASEQAESIERRLVEGGAPGTALTRQLRLVSKSCKGCHARFRD